jgi:DNA helicase II / ATP-dependent DNA helicase PcrA
MKLNEEQTAAVQHPLGSPAVLIAGAGSGKTRVLTERTRWLMEQGVAPRRICVLTFTNKAAGELKERLGIHLGSPPEKEPRVGTIHALALGGIRKNPKAFGLGSHVTPLDDYDQSKLMRRIIEQHDEEQDTQVERDKGFEYGVLEKISFHRARGVGFSNEYTSAVHARALEQHGGYHALSDEYVELWKLFEEEKLRQSVVDFDDMLHLVVRRMRNDPQWKASLGRQFEHVLMDEAQDTNPVQWEFVNGLLAEDNPNLYVVGDMSQSIYGFNGAVPRILKDYSENWRGHTPEMYRIARNHRSMKEIVWLANKIQKTMTETIPLQMDTHREEDGEWRTMFDRTPQHIAVAIAQQIASGPRHGILYKDNAVLTRSGLQMRDIEGELIRRRIPYVIRGGRALLQTEEIRDILSYLRLASNPKDFIAFMRCCSVPRCGVGEVALVKLRAEAKENYDGDLIEAAKSNKNLAKLVSIIDQIKTFNDHPVTAVNKLLSIFDYRAYIMEKYASDPDKIAIKLENIDRFVFVVASVAEENAMTLDDFIFQMALDRTKQEQGQKELYAHQLAHNAITQDQYDRKMEEIKRGAVVISTIHSAKGLEWKRVYVTNLHEGSIPNKFCRTEEEIEEERRLFYVACTRAKDTLVICVPELLQSKTNRKDFYRVAPSRFLEEIGVTKDALASSK